MMLTLIAPLVLVGLFFLYRNRTSITGSTGGGDAPAPIVGMLKSFPVREIDRRGGFGSRTRNSLSPTFVVASDRFRIKIFKECDLFFTDVREIDVTKSIIGSGILTISSNNGSFKVTVADVDVARTVLRALPTTIPLSARAAQLRGG